MREYLDTNELAERLHIGTTTLIRWRRELEGPPWVRYGKRHIRYPIAGVENWLAANLYGEEGGPLRLIMSEEQPDDL